MLNMLYIQTQLTCLGKYDTRLLECQFQNLDLIEQKWKICRNVTPDTSGLWFTMFSETHLWPQI